MPTRYSINPDTLAEFLQGDGTVLPRNNHHANWVGLINDDMKFKRGVLKAVKRFAESKPYRGNREAKEAKYRALLADLNAVYGLDVNVEFDADWDTDKSSGASRCYIATGYIVLSGRASVVTFLHEFAHALHGFCERRAVKWSMNLYKRTFPRSFAKLATNGNNHMATQ